MRQADRWTPSKYRLSRGRLVASRDSAELGIGSRLIASVVAARYADALPRYARGRLVDLGCGKVPLYGAYRDLVDAVTCVDWPASPHPSPHVDVHADLDQALPFENASFDTVILADVLEHVPSPQSLCNEIGRLLAPGGHLLANVPFLYGVHEAPHDYGRYTEFALRRFAAEAGLETIELVTLGGSAHVLADLLAKHLARLPLVGQPSAAGIQALVAGLDRTPWGRRAAAHSATRFPLGYFMVAAKNPRRRHHEPVERCER